MTETIASIPGRHKMLSDEDVARTAYFYWEQRGRPFGSPEVDWFKAEGDLRLQEEKFDPELDQDGRLPFSNLHMSPRAFED